VKAAPSGVIIWLTDWTSKLPSGPCSQDSRNMYFARSGAAITCRRVPSTRVHSPRPKGEGRRLCTGAGSPPKPPSWIASACGMAAIWPSQVLPSV